MVKPIGGSFRDPNGFVFKTDDVVYRQVNQSYKSNYDRLMESGLYDELIRRSLLIAHTEVCLEAQRRQPELQDFTPRTNPLRLLSLRMEFQPAEGCGAGDVGGSEALPRA